MIAKGLLKSPLQSPTTTFVAADTVRIKTAELTPLSFPTTRHLLYHVWPVSGYGVWQRNLSNLLQPQRIGLINGRRLIGIAVGHNGPSIPTDPPTAVLDFISEKLGPDHGFEPVIVENNRAFGELQSFVPMMERLEKDDQNTTKTRPNEIVIYAHAKGVKPKYSTLDTKRPVHRWTDVMYELLFDNWPEVERLLNDHAFVGSFRRLCKPAGGKCTLGEAAWFYSGTFWAGRLDFILDREKRDWRKALTRRYYGVEAFPGTICPNAADAACVFMDDCLTPYSKAWWEGTVEPELERWRSR